MESMKIPSPVIGLLGEIFDEFYTHAGINRVFAYADAPEDVPEGNKVNKTVDWLRRTNKISTNPLAVLGFLLEEILEKETINLEEREPWDNREEPNWSASLRRHQERIHAALDKAGLKYSVGGHIGHTSATPTASLEEIIARGGVSAVDLEVKRALKQVTTDPNAAVHYAGNVLEATFKAYLVKKSVKFNEQRDTLNDLWQLTRNDLGINPKDLEEKDLKKIATGLSFIVEGTMYLRNKKSGAHGRTENQLQNAEIRPRHARLVIHSAHTLAVYILECLADS